MKPKGERYTIAVDFDGVLHSYKTLWIGDDTIPDEPVAGAIDWLNEISRHLNVVIFTTRGGTLKGQRAVRRWLHKWGYLDAERALITNKKIPALVYLDDRGMRFEGTFPKLNDIHKAIPWNRRKATEI